VTWPGSPGAARGGPQLPWGDSVALVVRAALLSGTSWHIGPHAADRLDSGNVIGPLSGSVVDAAGRLWVDLACDTMNVEVGDSSSTGIGVVSRDEASTLVLTLYDPDRRYDPANSSGPYWLHGQSRLTAGTPIEVTAEVLNDAGTGVVSFPLFSGLVDTWSSEVEPVFADRRATVTASGAIKQLTSRDYGQDDTPVGASDTYKQRVDRILTRFGWPGTATQYGATSTARMAATDFQGSAWENLVDAADAEVGFLHVLPNGNVDVFTREYLLTLPLPAPALVLGCGVSGAYDIATALVLAAIDDQLRNAVYANRSSTGTGDTPVVQVARSPASIGAHGGVEAIYRKDKLTLIDDPTVAAWAQWVVALFAYPQPTARTVELVPQQYQGHDAQLWRAVLGMRVLRDILRTVWTPDDGSAPLDVRSWVMGVRHTISPTQWVVRFDLMAATRQAAKVWTMGPHANDKLNDANVIGWAA